MHWLLLGGAFAAPPVLDDDALASLTQPLAEGWDAPGEPEAREFWSRAAQAEAIELAKVHVTRDGQVHEAWFTIEDGLPRFAFAATDEATRVAREAASEHLRVTGDGWVASGVRMVRSWTSGTPAISERAWAPWSRLELLSRFQGDLYAELPAAAPPKAEDAVLDLELAVADGAPDRIREALAAVLASPPGPHDGAWLQVLAAAEEVGDEDAAFTIYRHYRPMGMCSMDDTPQWFARQYAEACRVAGRTGCAVTLQVLAIDYWAFDRPAWSSYGEAASETGVDGLASLGLAVPDVLVGVAMGFAGVEDLRLSPQRLGRAVHESAAREGALAAFREIAQDPAVDEYNRLMAAIVSHHALAYAGETLAPEGLGVASVAWLEAAQAAR